MYLGKEKGAQQEFLFDLERDLHTRPDYQKELLSKVEKNVQEIKQALRKGVAGHEFDRLGVILQGYSALLRVLKKAAK